MRTFISTLGLGMLLLFTSTSFIVEDNEMLATPGKLDFTFTSGTNNTFTFGRWYFKKFDIKDDQWSTAQMIIKMDATSLVSANKDLEAKLRDRDYFDVKHHHYGLISIKAAFAQGDGSYKADAVFKLNGHRKAVPITFRVTEGGHYHLIGGGKMRLSDFAMDVENSLDEVDIRFDFEIPNPTN